MPHTLESMLLSQNISPTKTGLFLILRESTQHSTIFTLTTTRFLAEEKSWYSWEEIGGWGDWPFDVFVILCPLLLNAVK